MQNPSRKGAARLIVGYAAITFMLPYLALKTAWISGAPVGFLNKSLVAEPSMLALNILTFFMDVVAASGSLHLLWAGGAPLGLSPLLLQSRDVNFYLLQATFGLAALCAAAGIILLVNRRGRWPLRVPLSLAWIGSAAMFSWGSWLLLAVVSPFSCGVTSWLFTANNVIKIGAGLLIGALIGSLVAATARSGFSEVARPQDSHVMQFVPGDDVSDGAHADSVVARDAKPQR